MKIKCQFCGEKVSKKDRFCPGCGKEIVEENKNSFESGDFYTSDDIAFVSFGDVFSGDSFFGESFHFTVAGEDNIVMGQSIKSLSVGDKLSFDSKIYRVLGFLNTNRRFCDEIEEKQICGVVLNESVDKKKLKKVMKNCPAKNKYAPFYISK